MSITLDLSNDDADAVQIMIWFLYFGGYPWCEDVDKDGVLSGPHLYIHAMVHALATKYGLTALISLAEKHMNTAAKAYLKKGLFPECIPLIYGSSTEPSSSMRRLFTNRLRHRMGKLINDEHRWMRYQAYIQRYPIFAYDVITALSTMFPQPTTNQYQDITLPTPPDSAIEVCPTTFGSPRSMSPTSTWASRGKRYLGYFIHSDFDGTLYDAALLAIRPRAQSNEFRHLQVVHTTDHQFQFNCWSGDVGTAGEFCGFEGNLDDAINEFNRVFRVLTGLDWERRFDQPVKSRFTFIGNNWMGFADVKAKPL